MDSVYEALDEAKAEVEKLKSDNRKKDELSASLKKSQNEQLVKIHEANLIIEKQAQELIEKEGEISVTRQMCEDLKCSLNEKDSIIKHLNNANDKLRVDCDSKSRKMEEENKVLVLALDEANEKNLNQEHKIYAFKEEIEGLKGLLAASQKKCLEAENKIKAAKELREGDHVLLDLEEEKRKVADQLKWKKEQFKHLEEAHDKLREQFKASEKERQMEKSALLNEISSLQTSLDSQTRISEDLQKRLEMCHQALAHEESRRKRLEVQLSEFQTRFENAFAECQDAESEVAGQREEEIGTLRSSLARKEMFCKEVEYRAQKLEQENEELLKSLKDLHEAQIQESGSKSSVGKLRVKLKSMEQKYQDCSKNLRTKEAEWSLQLKEVMQDFNNCKSELGNKDRAIEELMAELEGCHSLITQLKLLPKESERSSELDKLRKDFKDCRFELDSKAIAIEKLKLELEGCDSLMTQLKLENQDWSSQLEKSRRDFRQCQSELDSKDRAIEELMVELEGCNSLMTQFKLQIQESESQLEKLSKDFNDCRSESESKDVIIQELLTELEDCHSQRAKLMRDLIDGKHEIESENQTTKELMTELESFHSEMMELMLQKEEASMMLMLLKSGISEMQLKFINKETEQNLNDQERDKKVEALLTRIETLVHVEKQQSVMQKKLERYNVTLAEASSALERANSELVAKIYEGNAMEFELQIWKSFAQHLKVNLEENYEMRKELEASLLAQIEIEESLKHEKNDLILVLGEKDRRIDSLQQQLVALDQGITTRQTEAPSSARVETENDILDDLQKEVGLLEQESIRRELEAAVLSQIAAERTSEHDKQNLFLLVGEKNQRIDDLELLLTSLEQKLNSSSMSFSTQLSDKQAEINMASEAWEKITSAEVLAELEIEVKKLMIVELEGEIHNMQQKMEVRDKSLYASKQQMSEIEAELEAKESEMKRLTIEMEKKMRNLLALIDELKNEKQNFVEDITKLLSEQESMCCFLGEMDKKMDTLASKDEHLMETLGRIVQSFDTNPGSAEPFGSEKENISTSLAKTFEVTSEARSPFREVNS